MSKEWFEQWFDSKYYHILYNYRDEGEAKNFIVKLMDFLESPEDARIIDIGCGRGRHAKFLSEYGYDVTGIDIASSNIDFAKSYENEKLHFFCHDKRNIFKKENFDLALNLFTSYGYLKERTDLEKALKNMALNVKNGGLMVLDYLNAKQIKHQEFNREVITHEGVKFEIVKKIRGHQILKEIHVKDKDKQYAFREEVHLITRDEFTELFDYASLKILHTFGDYQLREFDEEKSDRLILIAEKI